MIYLPNLNPLQTDAGPRLNVMEIPLRPQYREVGLVLTGKV